MLMSTAAHLQQRITSFFQMTGAGAFQPPGDRAKAGWKARPPGLAMCGKTPAPDSRPFHTVSFASSHRTLGSHSLHPAGIVRTVSVPTPSPSTSNRKMFSVERGCGLGPLSLWASNIRTSQ